MKYAQYRCDKCGTQTPHKTAGAKSAEKDAQGRVSQTMECVKCKSKVEVLIDPKTGIGTRKS